MLPQTRKVKGITTSTRSARAEPAMTTRSTLTGDVIASTRSYASTAWRSLRAIRRLRDIPDEIRQPRVAERLPDALRLAEVKPVVIRHAQELRADALRRRLALPACEERLLGETVEIGVGGGRDRAPRRPHLVQRRRDAGLPVAAALDGGHERLALRALEPVGLLLPGQMSDDPADGVGAGHPAARVLGAHTLQAAHPFAAREPELRHERVRHQRARRSPAAASSTGGGVEASL